MNDNPVIKAATLAAGASATLLVGMALKYHDRAIFETHNPRTPIQKGYPLVGSLPDMLREKENLHDFTDQEFTKYDCMTL
jgi:hypothetical protein